MLSPRELDRMPDEFVALWQQVEDEILRDAARRIAKTGKLTETANWQLWRYQQTEAVRQKVVKLLTQYSGKSESTIRRLLKTAATEALEREDEIYYHYGNLSMLCGIRLVSMHARRGRSHALQKHTPTV